MNDEERKNYCYLGDSIYAFFDGAGIWLRTGHHDEDKCENKIYIENSGLNILYEFYNYINGATK